MGNSRAGLVLRIAAAAGFAVAVVLLMLWLAGHFHPKVTDQMPAVAAGAATRPAEGLSTVPVRLRTVPRIESAVGTIRATHEAAVASKVLARVVEVNVQAGQRVEKNQVLVRLDDADLRARLEQTRAAVEAARARRDRAQIDYDRIKRLYEQAAASKTEYDQATIALRAAEAELERARHAQREAETILDYATIRSPFDGVVIDKLVEPGDTVRPGQVLLRLYDPSRMQLVARVRESLTRRLAVGQTIGVSIDALHLQCEGRISEIVPEAEAASRTFSVKVTGPCPPGVYSGMFGRLQIPLDPEQVLVIPRNAVRRVGQLDLVDVVTGGRVQRRAVQLGRHFDNDVEVLSGLRAGERVVVPQSTDAG